MSTEIKEVKPHTVEITSRKRAAISGVSEVVGINDSSVSLNTSAGGLVLTGKNIRVSRFNREEGQLVLEGDFETLRYADKTVEDKRPLLKRLFS